MEETAQLVGMAVAAIIGGYISADAQRHGLPRWTALAWGMGVFLALIFVLPVYLWRRKNKFAPLDQPTKAEPIPCPYCEYPNAPQTNFCAKCQRLLRSSTEIHR